MVSVADLAQKLADFIRDIPNPHQFRFRLFSKLFRFALLPPELQVGILPEIHVLNNVGHSGKRGFDHRIVFNTRCYDDEQALGWIPFDQAQRVVHSRNRP